MPRKKAEEFIRFKEVSCLSLNVRNKPSTDALIIKVIRKGTVVECDKNFKNAMWDHIITDPYIEGYCMKEFLAPLNPDTKAVLKSEPIFIHSCDSKKSKEEIKDNGKKEKED